jgi:hypothetical protein
MSLVLHINIPVSIGPDIGPVWTLVICLRVYVLVPGIGPDIGPVSGVN